jgi:hypothetical protein
MAGIIYNKKIKNTLYQGTGEKCLVLEPYTAYQVPFSFDNQWHKIRLGVIWSWVSTTGANGNPDEKYNTPITDTTNGTGTMRFNAGGVTNVSNSFFGIMKDNEVKSLPFDADCSGFVGWQGNAIDFSNDTGDYAQKYLNRLYTTDPYVNRDSQPTFTGRSKLVWANGEKEEHSYVSKFADGDGSYNNFAQEGHICPRTYGLKNPYYATSGSGIDPSSSGDYGSFWGLEITHTGYVNNPVAESYLMEPLYYQGQPRGYSQPNLNHQYAEGCRISDASTENLRNIINGADLQDRAWYTLSNFTTDKQIDILLKSITTGLQMKQTRHMTQTLILLLGKNNYPIQYFSIMDLQIFMSEFTLGRYLE